MSTHPRMLYRSGNALCWNGMNLDTRIVADEDEERAAIAEGWRVSPHPLDHDHDGKPGGSMPKKRGKKRK